MTPESAPISPAPATIGERYEVLAHLGRGGSADVYRVREISSGRELALKRLRHDLPPARLPELTKHLEREFYALSQLRHPRVIEVYDYGVSEGLPHYTMEHLDGGDLRAMAPLPWRRACELTYDVASSLALLHSRRFVHRDVSPSNIRCTRDGRAKLIDFGAMVSMGAGATAIGTPAYVAPEVQQRGVLDASTDLFSLGATLYFTITGRAPFAALDLASMAAAWAVPPRPPSAYAKDVPAGLDALILSLLSLEPALRPRTAFEVMQRMAAVVDLRASEPANVSQGYLTVPHVVGREAALRRIRGHLQRALEGSGSVVWIEGEPGVGRSRLLDLCTLEAKTSGACVLRLDATSGATAFAGAGRLAHALRAALPEVTRKAFAESAAVDALIERAELERNDAAGAPAVPIADRASLQDALTRGFLAASATHPVVIAVDDAHRLDEPTLAWLAALAHAAPRARLLLLVTVETESGRAAHAALGVLRRHSSVSTVQPLTRNESDAMFATVFGAVPNLALLSERIFSLAAGNPRSSLALAQYLVDQGKVMYAAGAWSLPNELDLADMPASVEALFDARIARLGAVARRLAEAHALSLVAALRRDDYRTLAGVSDLRSLDDALTELIAHEIVRSEGAYYVLAHRGYAAALLAKLEPHTIAERHEALARLAEQRGSHTFVVAYHLLFAGREAQAIDLLVQATETPLASLYDLDSTSVRAMLERALTVSEASGRPKREHFDLMRLTTGVSLFADTDLYFRVAPAFCAQLASDTGLGAYRAHAEITEPAERLRVSFEETQARYLATPERDRVYRFDEALRLLALHVARSIAIGARTLDIALLRSLPPLLEPFTSISPIVRAIYENVEASCDSSYRARPERAYARWQRVFEGLELVDGEPNAAVMRSAVAYGLGELAAAMGLSVAALHWIERLDREPMQRVNAMRVRRSVCMHHGDWEGAERAREQAELMALQASSRQIFEAPVRTELYAQWLAHDLAGVKQTSEDIGRLAAAQPGWRMYHQLSQGYFQALRGDAAAALQLFEACIERCQPVSGDEDRPLDVWLRASAAALASLLELGRVDEARARGEQILARCRALEIGVSSLPIACELALAEAQIGEAASALSRIDAVIADQRSRGVTGLLLGASFEARARIAIILGDHAAAAEYIGLVAQEYRHGGVLASRYGRLLQEARRAGVRVAAQASDSAPEPTVSESDVDTDAVAHTLEGLHGRDRARSVLELWCEHGRAKGGHLFLANGADRGLELVASVGESEAPEALTRFAHAFWSNHLEEAEMSAVLTELPWARESYEPFVWTDPNGDLFEVLVLYSAKVSPAHVGLACLRAGKRDRAVVWSTASLSAFASQLKG